MGRISADKMAREINKAMQEYKDLTRSTMQKAVRQSAKTVKDEIAKNAPRDTGQYAKSWTMKKTQCTSHSLVMTVYSKDRYQIAHLLEFGHAKRGGGRVRAYPHIASAEEKGAAWLEAQLLKEL